MDDTFLLNDGKAYGTFEADGTANSEFDSSPTLNSQPTENAPCFRVERNALSMVTIDELAPPLKGKQNFPEKVHSAFRSSMNFSCECFTKFCKRSFPILTWLPEYSIKNDLLLDVITGVTLLILHVPQGMAYAQLASVPPIYGLYTSFYPVLIYFFLGTSKHISIGTFAVASLLAGSEVEEVMHQQYLDQKAREHAAAAAFNFTTQSSNFTLLHNAAETPLPFSRIQVAMVVTFTVGFLQTVMGILRMGALTSFMSDEMISAFVTGTVIHVFTSQLKPLTGIVFMKYSGPFNIILSWIALFENIKSVNYVVLILSVCGIVVLLIIKEGVNAFLLTKTKVPIPAELILVIGGTLVSYFLDLQKCCNVDIVGFTPTNLLPPTVPPLQLVPKVLTASMVLSVVCATITLSIVIIYAKKHKYEVDTNQELIAYGVAGLVSSFFFCIPSCASLSRSAVQESTGAKSQIASLVSCALMIVVLLVLGPYFESLPNCILSAVIVVSLKGLLLHFKDLKRAWNTSKLDASVWVVTFLSVVILDMDYGLVIGIVFSLITILFRSQYPETCLLGHLPGTELYRSTEKYPNVHEMPGIKIVHFGASVYFGNRDYFRSQILHLTNVHKRSLEVQATLTQLEQNDKQKSIGADQFTFSKSEEVDDYLRCIILAFSAVAYIDSGGVATLLQVIKEFSANNVTVYLASVQEPVLESLESQGFFNTVSQKHIFPTIHDAVLFALSQRTSS